MSSSTIGKFAIGVSPIGLPDSYDKENCVTAVYVNATVMTVVTLSSGTASGVVLNASGTIAGDTLVQAFDLTTGANVLILLAPRVPTDGVILQMAIDGYAAGHLALVLLRRTVLVEQAVELVPVT